MNNTGVYEGAFSAAATAVARGLFHVGEETWLVGRGSQYLPPTHCTAVLLTFTQSVCIYEYTYLRDLDLPVVQRAHETCTQSDLD